MVKQKHIYFFLPNFNIGGAANSILNICRSLDKKKYSLKVISIGKNHYKKNFKSLNIEVIEIQTKKTITGILRIYYKLRTVSKKKNIIFVSNINYANVLSVIFLKKINNLKLVIIERTPLQELELYTDFIDYLKKRVIFYLAKIFYKHANYIIGNSSDLSAYIKSKFRLNVLTIHPIVHVKKMIKKKNNKEIQITWIGRHSYEKRLFDFIKCIKNLSDYKVKFNIVTDTNIKKKVKLLLSNKAYSKINFYFFKNNSKFISYIYNKTDILVNTSIYEGFPNTIVEATSYNCLIVASKSFGGYKEIIPNNNFGFLYKVGDINELSTKLKYAIKNFKLCKFKIINAKNNLIKLSKNNDRYNNFFNRI